jgi:hypothetical protein
MDELKIGVRPYTQEWIASMKEDVQHTNAVPISQEKRHQA